MKKQRSGTFAMVLLFYGSLGFCSLTNAADAPPSVPVLAVAQKHMMQNALMVQFTNRGLNLFHDHLQALLSNLGVSTDEAYFDAVQWQAKNPIDLNQIDKNPQTQNLITSVRDALKDWFVGFPLISSIQPVVQVGPSAYHAVFNKLSISADEKMLKSMGKTEGIVLTLDMEIQEMDFRSTQAVVWNGLTPEFGKISLQNPVLKIGGGQFPLIIRMPFYVSVGADGIPQFEAISVDQNLNQVDFSYSYQNLSVPEIALIVNGNTYKMNHQTLETLLQKQSPAIRQELAQSLHTLASEQLPKLLNEKAKQQLNSSLEEVKQLNPPGGPMGVSSLLWGLQLGQPKENNDLELKLNTYVEDPLRPNLPLNVKAATGIAKMDALAGTEYDVGLVIDEAMINRMLQLSFTRGYFDKIPLDGSQAGKPQCASGPAQASAVAGKYLKLTEEPQLLPLKDGGDTGQLGETFAKIHLSVQVPKGTVSGLEKIAIKDNFVVSFDLIVKLAGSAKNGVLIHMWQIDPNSVALAPGSLTLIGEIAFKGFVMNALQDTFKTVSQEWQCNGTTFPGNVQVPEIFGINLSLKHLMMEKTGHLVLYMTYAGSLK